MDRCPRRWFSMAGKESSPQTRRPHVLGRKVVKKNKKGSILGWSGIQRCPPDHGRRLRQWLWLCKLCLCLRRIFWMEVLRTGLRWWKGRFNVLYSIAFTLFFPPCLKLFFLFLYTMETQGFLLVCLFVFWNVERDLFFHFWKFRERYRRGDWEAGENGT